MSCAGVVEFESVEVVRTRVSECMDEEWVVKKESIIDIDRLNVKGRNINN